jgi:hypothetical protein
MRKEKELKESEFQFANMQLIGGSGVGEFTVQNCLFRLEGNHALT